MSESTEIKFGDEVSFELGCGRMTGHVTKVNTNTIWVVVGEGGPEVKRHRVKHNVKKVK